MSKQLYIVSVSYRRRCESPANMRRHAVVGTASIATLERAISSSPILIHGAIRGIERIRNFVDGRPFTDGASRCGRGSMFASGVERIDRSDQIECRDDDILWCIAIGEVHEVL